MNTKKQWLENYKEKLLIEQDVVDSTLGMISSNIVSGAMLFGTVTIAAVPALFTGFSIYKLTLPLWQETMALAAAWVFGVGLETVGMVTANVALKLYRAWREGKVILEEFLVTIVLMLVYVVTVAVVIAFVEKEQLPLTLKAIGAGSPFLAVVLYIARGLYLDHSDREAKERLIASAEKSRQAEVEDEERKHRQEMERLKALQAHERKLRKIETEIAGNRTGNLPATTDRTGNLPENLPPWLPCQPDDLREFKALVNEGVIVLPPGLTGSDLQKHIPGVGTDRTGRNWLEAIGYRRNGVQS